MHTTAARCRYLDITPAALVPAATNAFVDAVTNNKNLTDSGIIGSAYMLQTLVKVGRGDIALRISLATSEPSWGNMVLKGPGTIWESWDDSTNSHNHPALSADIGVFLYTLAGVEPSRWGRGANRCAPPHSLMRWSFHTHPYAPTAINTVLPDSLGGLLSAWTRLLRRRSAPRMCMSRLRAGGRLSLGNLTLRRDSKSTRRSPRASKAQWSCLCQAAVVQAASTAPNATCSQATAHQSGRAPKQWQRNPRRCSRSTASMLWRWARGSSLFLLGRASIA